MAENDENEFGTTGHVWDGIQEWNKPLPRWWVWTFYVTILWGIVYTIAYPAWPLVRGATEGFLGYSTRAEVAKDIAAVEAQNAEVSATLASADLATLPQSDPAYEYGVSGGKAVFLANCSQCHGAGAAGVQAAGYPNLLDDAWLWGGDVEAIEYTVRHGIRNDLDPDTRWSEMPAFGDILSRDEVAQVVAYVRQISGQEADASAASAGATLYADNCASCHGEDGGGIRDLGAPNISDAIWLYGGDETALTETVMNARFGVMPSWNDRLSDAEIKAVTLYVHQLGGGE